MKKVNQLENLIFKDYEQDTRKMDDQLDYLGEMPKSMNMHRKAGKIVILKPKTIVDDSGHLLNQNSYLPESMVVKEIFSHQIKAENNAELEYAFNGVDSLSYSHKSVSVNNQKHSTVSLDLNEKEIYLDLGKDQDFEHYELKILPEDIYESNELLTSLYLDAGKESGVDHLELQFDVDTLGYERQPISKRTLPPRTNLVPSRLQDPLVSLFENNPAADTSSSLLPSFEQDIQQQVYTEMADYSSIDHMELQNFAKSEPLGKDVVDFKKFLNSIVREIKSNPQDSIQNISAKVGDSVVNPFTGKTVGKDFLMKLYTETSKKGVRKSVTPLKQPTSLSEKEKVLIKAVASLFSPSKDKVEESGDLFGSNVNPLGIPFTLAKL